MAAPPEAAGASAATGGGSASGTLASAAGSPGWGAASAASTGSGAVAGMPSSKSPAPCPAPACPAPAPEGSPAAVVPALPLRPGGMAIAWARAAASAFPAMPGGAGAVATDGTGAAAGGGVAGGGGGRRGGGRRGDGRRGDGRRGRTVRPRQGLGLRSWCCDGGWCRSGQRLRRPRFGLRGWGQAVPRHRGLVGEDRVRRRVPRRRGTGSIRPRVRRRLGRRRIAPGRRRGGLGPPQGRAETAGLVRTRPAGHPRRQPGRRGGSRSRGARLLGDGVRQGVHAAASRMRGARCGRRAIALHANAAPRSGGADPASPARQPAFPAAGRQDRPG